MSQTVLEMATDLVQAQIQIGAISPGDMQSALEQMMACLTELKTQEAVESQSLTREGESAPGPLDWKRSITRHSIICLECGATFKQLQVRHLKQHGLTAHSYRTKYGIPSTQPLVAKATAARRRQIVNQIRPWEKSPHFLKAQQATPKKRMAVKTRQSKVRSKAARV